MMPPKLLAALALYALPVQAALAADNACLTRDEAKGIAMFILPDTVVALREKCGATLAADAYLNRPDASERFRATSTKHWPLARAAFAKFAGGGKVLDIIGDEAARRLLVGSVAEGVTKDLKPKSCPGVDGMLSALAPLPPQNMEMLLTSFFALGLGGKGSDTGKFRICQDATASAPLSPKSPG